MLSNLSLTPATELKISQLADLLSRGFEEYLVPIDITENVLLAMIRRDDIDLLESRVLHKDGEPIGVALISRRGWAGRLAAMGLMPNARNSGAGTWIMQQLIEEAQARGDREISLEVIEQNTAGVKLYQKVGFKIIRRLVGYNIENPGVESTMELQEMDITELAKQVADNGLGDLPWPLSGITLAHHTPPSRAFYLNDACCLISNPEVEHVSIVSVLVKVDLGGAGQGQALMRALFARFPNKTWHASPIYPEEMGFIFEQAGMQREEISQLQMSLTL
jgi:ribosomal protein S18 acetylase RimI-like enzyme